MTDEIKGLISKLNKIIDDSIEEYQNFIHRLEKDEISKGSKIEKLNSHHTIFSNKPLSWINDSFPIDDSNKIVHNGIEYISLNSAQRLILYTHSNTRSSEFIRIKNNFIDFLND